MGVVVIGVIVSTGCSDDKSGKASPSSSTSQPAATSTPTSAPAGDTGAGAVTRGPATKSGPSQATAGDFNAAAPPSGGSNQNAAKPKHPLKVSLASPCIRVGEKQSITIETIKGSGVGYDSYYPDGKSGLSEGFYGGNNGKNMESETVWTDMWVVSPTAPPGTVRVISQGISLATDVNQVEVFFDLKPATGSC